MIERLDSVDKLILNRANIINLFNLIPSLRAIKSSNVKVVEFPNENRNDKVILHVTSSLIVKSIMEANAALFSLGFDVYELTVQMTNQPECFDRSIDDTSKCLQQTSILRRHNNATEIRSVSNIVGGKAYNHDNRTWGPETKQVEKDEVIFRNASTQDAPKTNIRITINEGQNCRRISATDTKGPSSKITNCEWGWVATTINTKNQQ